MELFQQRVLQSPCDWFMEDKRFDNNQLFVTYFCNTIFQGRERFMESQCTAAEYNEVIESMIFKVQPNEVYFVVASPTGLQASPLEQYVDVVPISSPLFLKLIIENKVNNNEGEGNIVLPEDECALSEHADLLRHHLGEFTHAFTYRIGKGASAGPYFNGALSEEGVECGARLRNSLNGSVLNGGCAGLFVVKTNQQNKTPNDLVKNRIAEVLSKKK